MASDLKGIGVFVAVVEAGSFARAAEKEHQTRSAISKSIARLEQRLGVLLFHRTTRSQSLTEEGQLFYTHCLRALEEIRTAEGLLEGAKEQVSGRLRVSMPTLFGHLCISPILIELAQDYPGLALEMSFNDRVIDLVEEGIDLAIRIGSLPNSGSLVARKLGEHRMAFCASPLYLQRRGEPKTLEDLRQHDAVSYTRFDRPHSGLSRVELEVLQAMPKTRVLMDDMRAVTDAALAHLGIAWIPYWLAREHLLQGELQEVLATHVGASYAINALWPHTPHLPLKTRTAVDALLAKLPSRLAVIESRSLPGEG